MLNLESLLLMNLHVQYIFHNEMTMLVMGWWMPWVAELNLALDGV